MEKDPSFPEFIMSSPKFLRLLDGGMGELLFKKYKIPDDRMTWSARALIDDELNECIIKAHLDYLRAGSRIIITNNYAVTPYCMGKVNDIYNERKINIERLTKLAVDLAYNAKNIYLTENKNIKENDVLIAGSLPPLMESYRHDKVLPSSAAIYWYEKIGKVLYDNNVDIFCNETVSSINEGIYAMNAIGNILKDGNRNKPIQTFVSFSLNDKGNLRSNETFKNAIFSLEPWIKRNNISIISLNCAYEYY